MKEIQVKSVLNKKKKRDSWFLDDYTLNPYEGCSFNCQYCYVRGSKYGENMEDTLAIKANGPSILERQLALRARKNQRGIIALASATEPYIKAEERYRITRQYLEMINRYNFPVLILTKSDLVLRDVDLLKQIDRTAVHADDLKQHLTRGAFVSFSFSTLDDDIASSLEPGAPLPSKRLETMRLCKEAGLHVGMNCIPLLPFISDGEQEIEQFVVRGKEAGADYVLLGGLTLFGNGKSDSRTLFLKSIQRKYPHLVTKYANMYEGSYFPSWQYNKDLASRSARICEKHGVAGSILNSLR